MIPNALSFFKSYHFDLRLVACMLVLLKMTTEETKKAYLRLYESAFKPETRTKEQRASDLRRALQNLLDGQAGNNESMGTRLSVTKMRDVEKKCGKCKLCVFTIPISVLHR